MYLKDVAEQTNLCPFFLMQGKSSDLAPLLSIAFLWYRVLIWTRQQPMQWIRACKPKWMMTYISSWLGTREHHIGWTPPYLHVQKKLDGRDLMPVLNGFESLFTLSWGASLYIFMSEMCKRYLKWTDKPWCRWHGQCQSHRVCSQPHLQACGLLLGSHYRTLTCCAWR